MNLPAAAAAPIRCHSLPKAPGSVCRSFHIFCRFNGCGDPAKATPKSTCRTHLSVLNGPPRGGDENRLRGRDVGANQVSKSAGWTVSSFRGLGIVSRRLRQQRQRRWRTTSSIKWGLRGASKRPDPNGAARTTGASRIAKQRQKALKETTCRRARLQQGLERLPGFTLSHLEHAQPKLSPL